MSFEDVIKLTGKYTVARILERDDLKIGLIIIFRLVFMNFYIH